MLSVAARIRIRRAVVTGGAVLLLIALSAADRSGCFLAAPADRSEYHLAQTRVVRVIDGDTLEVDRPDRHTGAETTRVRLWGVDCPELTDLSGGSSASPIALEARRFVETVVLDQLVTLRLEPGRTRGTYGRLLAHVDLPDGSSLEEALISQGFARVDSRAAHALLERFLQLEWSARRGRRGLWATEAAPSAHDPNG